MGGTAQVTPTPANTQLQPPGGQPLPPPPGILHEVIAPDGTRGTSSSAELQGLPEGYKVTGRLRMYAPDGKRGYADPEALPDLTRAGYRLTPETQLEQERSPKNQPGFWASVGSTIANQAKGAVSDAKNYVLGPIEDTAAVYKASRQGGAGVIPSMAKAAVPAMFDPEVHQVLGAANLSTQDQQRGAAGHSLPYRADAILAQQVAGVDVPAMERAAEKGNYRAVGASALVPAGEILAAEAARPILKSAPVQAARESLAEKLARPTLERTLSATKADAKYGHVPERAIVGEKITTAEQAEAKMKDLGEQIHETLNKPEHVQKTIDVKNIIMQNARGAIADAKRAGNPAAARRIAQVRDAMLHSPEYGNLAKSPRAAAAMKTQLYGDVKWTGAEHESEVNGFRKAVAGQIRDEVNKAAPEVKELNQRYGNAAAAKEALERSEMLRSNRGMTTRLKEGAVAQGTRKIAQVIGKQYERPGPGITAQRNAGEGGITRGGGGNGTQPGPGITRPPAPRQPGPGLTQAKPAAFEAPRPRQLPAPAQGVAEKMTEALKPKPEARPLTDRRVENLGGPEGAERRLAERRAAVQEGTGPLMRQAIVDEAKKIIADPTATAEDKRIAQERIADIQAHPGEKSEPIDLNRVRAAGQRNRSAAPAGTSPAPRAAAPAGMTSRERLSAIRSAADRAERIRRARLVPSS